MEKVFNLREFINEDDTQDIEKATEIIDLMQSNGKSIATISKELIISRSSVYYVVDPIKKEQAKKQALENYYKNQKERRETQKIYYEKNKADLRAKQKEYYEKRKG